MITVNQRNAASLYWTQILTGELLPEQLNVTKPSLPSFMGEIENENRK